MGEENKNVKKPAVSNAVVKKRSAGTGTKSTGGTRPGNGTKSTGSTRPGSGTSAGSAHSNRTGSGVKNTVARSNGGSARNTSAHSGNGTKSANTGSVRSNNTSGRKTQPQKRRRRRITANQFTLLLAVVVGIILLFMVNGIMRGRYLKVKQISSEYVLGSKFDITAQIWRDVILATFQTAYRYASFRNNTALYSMSDCHSLPHASGRNDSRPGIAYTACPKPVSGPHGYCSSDRPFHRYHS